MSKTCINCGYDSFDKEGKECPMCKMPYPFATYQEKVERRRRDAELPKIEDDDEG